jgi:hypothetical protein
VLVAAVFDAFLSIYRARTADLLRIAGVRIESGVKRDLHPDLVRRLTREATKSAEHVMRMCIRALDYLPPVDVKFGEFLRALVTADTDLVPDDPMGYRLALIEAFRRRGILPENCLSLAPDSLLWESPGDDRLTLATLAQHLDLTGKFRRSEAMAAAEKNREQTHVWLLESEGEEIDRAWQDACGVLFRPGLSPEEDRRTVSHWPKRQPTHERPGLAVEVHSVRTCGRTGPDGQDLRQLIVEVTQRRRGFYDPKIQDEEDAGDQTAPPLEEEFVFRGGATLIFDLREGVLRYAIRKRISDDDRLERQRAYQSGRAAEGLGYTYDPRRRGVASQEPFAVVHRGG